MSKPLILVVDDNSTHLKVCALLLDMFGYSSCCLENPVEALEAFASTDAFAAVLMDWRMPEMDGIRCMKRMRSIDERRSRRTPIVAVTAAAHPTEQKKLLDSGMDDYLSKPFTAEQFQGLLTKHVSKALTSTDGLLQSASLAIRAGDDAAGEFHMLQVISLLEHIFGSDQQMTVSAVNALAREMLSRGYDREASALQRQAEQVYRR
jgi:CheY-like chemotaxis protein